MSLAATYPALVEKVVLLAPISASGWHHYKTDANGVPTKERYLDPEEVKNSALVKAFVEDSANPDPTKGLA